MSIAEVGAGSQRASAFVSPGNFLDIVYPADVVADSLLVCAGQAFGTTPTSVTLTDTVGTPYSVINFVVNAAEVMWIAYGIAPGSGGNTVRVTPNTTPCYMSGSIDEFSGTGIVLSANGGNSTGTSTAPGDSITTLTADELVIGCMGYDGANTTIAPGGSWVQIGEHEDNSADEASAVLFGIVAAAQAYTVDWTLGTFRVWQCMTASFRETVPGSSQPVMFIVT